MEYRLRWVPGVGSLRWACTFHIFCVDFICVGRPTQTRFSVEYGLAIMGINRKIVNLNKSNKTIPPWMVYERLMDGLHWDNELKDSCAKTLVSAAGRLLE